ncbi:AraC family transcriptional regulator [Mycobacterium adipatum]|jgi:AraC-like DNA-binding protein|uniref:AraC family transcriptional regulator n=1 Tax=Mycobacterium adipatum TaxID=1682113 RepID=A0A172UPT6_9MYCO|nr:AraC family transcriptional regulator [Mycobacterium adipatum]ANE81105.1 AraC family transcriptional regulator [Mycobacterium adipatum]MBI5736187.1 AraC family transcriptional regulator [Mycolicibacterium neoaurum]
MSRLKRLGFIDVRHTEDPVRRKTRSRGVPPALTGNEIFYTENIREAGTLMGQALSPLTLHVADEHLDGFAAGLHGVRLRNVSMLYFDLHVPATIDIPRVGNYVAVHMPMNGCALVSHRGNTFEANSICSAVCSPGHPLIMRLDLDSPQLIIRIEEPAMAAYLTRVIGRRLAHALAFEPQFDLTSEAAMRWHAAVQLIHTEVFHPGSLVGRGQGIGAVEELVMSSLLHLQPSNYHNEFASPGRTDKRKAVVQAAIDYLDDHLAERITMSSLAGAVHMSVRAVQQGFHEQLGMSPMTYLRERRLERVHEELMDATPADGITVTSVAERWGFHHLGSFGGEYRKRWGESPSQTLRR